MISKELTAIIEQVKRQGKMRFLDGATEFQINAYEEKKSSDLLHAIDKAKKIKDAEEMIEKIDELLSDSSLFRHQADSLYDKISKNIDYAPFIATAKAASGMGGNIPFKELLYKTKRMALMMIRDAIKVYIAEELTKKEN